MKIGLTFFTCIADIVNGKVDESEVAFVIGPSDRDYMGLSNSEEWKRFWNRNSHSHSQKWHSLDEEKVFNVVSHMDQIGLLFYPSNDFWFWSNGYFNQIGCGWVEIYPGDEHATPAVKEAWNHYRLLAGLCR